MAKSKFDPDCCKLSSSHGFRFGKSSLYQLSTVHPDLERIAHRGLEILNQAPDGVDVTIVQGARSPSEAEANAIARKGIVNSKHVSVNGKRAKAFDFCAVGPNQAARYNINKIIIISSAFLQAADELNVMVRSGRDWNLNGVDDLADKWAKDNKLIYDAVHIELIEPTEWRYADAMKARDRRIEARKNGERWPL